MAKKKAITNLPLYATDNKGKKIEQFKVVWLGPVAVGCIKDNTTEKEFLQLHCEKCDQLQAKNKRLKEELVEMIYEFVAQTCTMQDGTLDSMAFSTYARAMRFLAKQGVIEIEKEYGRRVIGKWTDQALKGE